MKNQFYRAMRTTPQQSRDRQGAVFQGSGALALLRNDVPDSLPYILVLPCRAQRL
jgi:hypothetical protein